MKARIAAGLMLVSLLFTLGVHWYDTPANAAPVITSPCNVSTGKLAGGWFVNADETDRYPTQVVAGVEFSGNDLIHRGADLKMVDLKPGSFVATPAPDQDSFFSVEVRDSTTNAYGTLRWNTGTNVWDLNTNLDSFHHANAADFVGTDTKWGKLTSAAKVITFGVGYTNSPPGTVKTTVKSITFNGDPFDLTCAPKPVPSPYKTTAKPTPSKTTKAPVSTGTIGGGPSLPVTGPSTGILIGVGAGVVVGGLILFVVGRRRKTSFTA